MKICKKSALDFALKEYIKAFEDKHGLTFEFAVNDELFGVISFGCVLYFNMSDIIYDIDNDLPKGMIIDWLYDNLDNEDNTINLHSYYKGLRHKDLNKLKNK